MVFIYIPEVHRREKTRAHLGVTKGIRIRFEEGRERNLTGLSGVKRKQTGQGELPTRHAPSAGGTNSGHIGSVPRYAPRTPGHCELCRRSEE